MNLANVIRLFSYGVKGMKWGEHAYHVTPASNVQNILKRGLKPAPGNKGKGVYAFRSQGHAEGYFGSFGHPKGTAIVEVRNDGDFEDPDSDGSTVARGHVPASRISRIFLYDGARGSKLVKTLVR